VDVGGTACPKPSKHLENKYCNYKSTGVGERGYGEWSGRREVRREEGIVTAVSVTQGNPLVEIVHSLALASGRCG
jgi:hypothetical protein